MDALTDRAVELKVRCVSCLWRLYFWPVCALGVY